MKKLTLNELWYISDALDYWRAVMIDKREYKQADDIVLLRQKIDKEIK